MSSDVRLDAALAIELSGIMAKLRVLRIKRAGLSQEALGSRVRVAGRTVSNWETGSEYPTLAHMLAWCRQLEVRLLILGTGGQGLRPRVERRAGEGWVAREARRMATALRAERLASGRSQLWVAARIGNTRVSVNRWENFAGRPRIPVLGQWTAALGCSLTLEPRVSGYCDISPALMA